MRWSDFAHFNGAGRKWTAWTPPHDGGGRQTSVGKSIRKFLLSEAAYQSRLEDLEVAPVPLKILCHSLLLTSGVLKDLVRLRCEVDLDEPDYEHGIGEDVEEAPDDRWDRLVRRALEEHAKEAIAVHYLTQAEVLALLRRSVRWDTTKESFDDSLMSFILQYRRCVTDHGLARVLGNKLMQRKLLDLLAACLPPAFADLMTSEVAATDVKTVDDWFVLLNGQKDRYAIYVLSRKSIEGRGSGIQRTPHGTTRPALRCYGCGGNHKQKDCRAVASSGSFNRVHEEPAFRPSPPTPYAGAGSATRTPQPPPVRSVLHSHHVVMS